jgi:4-hydroxy-3-polyprenylbenzoate decarboxylase/2,5-furandicarboxylate decarboxylase 1
MPFQDLRQFLDVLRSKRELAEVNGAVHLSDIGKALKQTYHNQGPALIFTNNGTEFPLVAGLYSTRSKAMIAFEATEQTIVEKLQKGLENPIPPRIYAGSPPCQEHILTGDKADITRFPVPIYSPRDGGPYITPGIVVSKDPETGIPDIGHYRFMINSKNLLSFDAQPFHRFGKNLSKYQRLGLKPTAALVIGVDPVIAYTCQFQVPDSVNDWEVAGGLRGAPVELTKCKTIDIEVPATAEVVIEFEVDFDHVLPEGPLGEYTGYYDAPGKTAPTARITTITHRDKPYFQGLLTGKPITENHILKQIPFEASFFHTLKRQFPTVERVAFPASGGVSFFVVIAMRPRFAGEARQVILAAMSTNIRPKWVVVVDTDIDVQNFSEVQWAMCFRVQPSRDVFVVDGMPSGPADPSHPLVDKRPAAYLLSSSVGIDATFPHGDSFPDVADVPGWRDYVIPGLET